MRPDSRWLRGRRRRDQTARSAGLRRSPCIVSRAGTRPTHDRTCACGRIRLVPRTTAPIALAELGRLYKENGQRVLRMSGQLVRTLRVLSDAGIRAAAYKGPALAEFAYGDMCVRQITDLDILVSPIDIVRAQEVLLENGYQRRAPLHEITPRALLQSQCEVVLSGDDGLLLLELHWRVGQRFARGSLDAGDLLARAQWVSLLGTEVLVPAPADLAVSLCLHGARHVWEQFEQIATFGAVLRHLDDDDVDAALDVARKGGALRRFLIGCLLARDVVDVPLPRALEAAVAKDPLAQSLSATVARHICEADIGGPLGLSLPSLRWQALAHDTIVAGLGNLVARAVVPSLDDWDALDLPEGLWPLYYAVRPVRLAGALMRRGRQKFQSS